MFLIVAYATHKFNAFRYTYIKCAPTSIYSHLCSYNTKNNNNTQRRLFNGMNIDNNFFLLCCGHTGMNILHLLCEY